MRFKAQFTNYFSILAQAPRSNPREAIGEIGGITPYIFFHFLESARFKFAILLLSLSQIRNIYILESSILAQLQVSTDPNLRFASKSKENVRKEKARKQKDKKRAENDTGGIKGKRIR